LTGVFASKAVNSAGADGLIYGSTALLIPQIASVAATLVLAGGGTALILIVLRAVMGLRVDGDGGIDQTEHDEAAYSFDGIGRFTRSMPKPPDL
jgi:ammonium transporter, Amt family